MMESPTIVVEVTADGQIRLDAQCFRGSACAQATDQLVRRLAELGFQLEAEDRQIKPEMAETEGVLQRHRAQQ